MQIAVILWLLCIANAKDVPFRFWGSLKSTVLACSDYVTRIRGLCPDLGLTPCLCYKTYAYDTMAGCLVDSSSKPNATVEYFVTYCDSVGLRTNLTNVYDAYDRYITTAQSASANQTQFSAPVRLNRTEIAVYRNAYKTLYDNKDRSIFYGFILLGYWGVVFAIAALVRLILLVCPHIRLDLNGAISKSIRRFFTLSPLHRRSRLNATKSFNVFHFYAPSRLQSLILIGFIALTTVLCSIGYLRVEDDPLHPTPTISYAHYAANRTGIISGVLVPLVVLLSQRSSILQWATGWNHSTFLLYHRWIARVTVLLALLHTALAVTKVTLSGLFFKVIGQWYLVWGIVGMVAGIILCFHSFLYIRRRWYEVFYVMHVVFGVVFLAASWIHLSKLGYLFLMFIAVVIWILERIARLIRLVVFGAPMATVSLHNNETLRVKIPRPRYWKSIPGGHGWLTFGPYFWQSHPFTLYESVVEKDTIMFLCGVKSGVTGAMAKKLASEKSINVRVCVEGPYGESTPCQNHSSAVFVAGGNGFPGIFSEVYHRAQVSPDSNQKLKLYWIIRDLKSLTWVYDELEALSRTKIETTIYVTRPPTAMPFDVPMEKQPLETRGELCKESLEKDKKYHEGDDESVWSELSLAISEILTEYMSDTQLLSSSEETIAEIPDSIPEKTPISLLAFHQVSEMFPHIKFIQRRPNMSQLVDQEMDECMESAAFISCGHPAMVDDLRMALLKKMGKCDKRIDCFDQLQSWA